MFVGVSVGFQLSTNGRTGLKDVVVCSKYVLIILNLSIVLNFSGVAIIRTNIFLCREVRSCDSGTL